MDPGSVPGSQRGQQSPCASTARLPRGQGGQERWKQVTSASRHSHSPHGPSSHFSPFCTRNTERPASVAKESLCAKWFCHAWKYLGKLQGYTSASGKWNISGTVSARRAACLCTINPLALFAFPEQGSLQSAYWEESVAREHLNTFPLSTPSKAGVFQLAASPFYVFTSLLFLWLKAFSPVSKFCCLTCRPLFHSLVTSAWICSLSVQTDTRNLSSVSVYDFA